MPQRVTLSFDNGPSRVTAQVLDLLAERGIRASFFVVGEQLRRPGARALAERAVTEGHRLGNHSLTHTTPLGVRDDPQDAEREIDAMQALLGELVPGERFFRPFGGGGVIDRNLLGRHALFDRMVFCRYRRCSHTDGVPSDPRSSASYSCGGQGKSL
jgi:peptidoglycan/xylan/chitin deacetylase (PgdA/CDA1 family)